MYSYNPYNAYNSPQNAFPQRTDIIHINGENGARAFQMLPNSSALLLDDTAPLVWLAQTDGAGYKTVTPYKIEEYRPTTASDLESRIRRLEEIINAQSNIEPTETERPRMLAAVKSDPQRAFTQMMQTSPQFRQFVEDNKGRTPEQIAAQYGINLNQISKLIR